MEAQPAAVAIAVDAGAAFPMLVDPLQVQRGLPAPLKMMLLLLRQLRFGAAVFGTVVVAAAVTAVAAGAAPIPRP